MSESADATVAPADSTGLGGDDSWPSLLLLDGHSLAYRAFFALPDTLRTQTGELTNAVYGFTSMLIKLLAEHAPDAIAVAFDKGRDVARTEAVPDYKANRAAPPDEFRPQVELIKQVLDALAIPVVVHAGIEADDVLATIATRARDAGYEVAVVTGDRDAMQLVDDRVTVLYTLRGITELAEMTPASVEERYGVPPGAYVDLAALRGDTSDNLAGVPGVGDKTAAKLISTYGDIDGVYAHLDEIGGKKVPAMLAEHEDRVRLNRQVMRLRRDVDLDIGVDDLARGEHDPDAVRELFGTLEFRALYDRFVADVLGDIEDATAARSDQQVQVAEAGGLARWIGAAKDRVAVVVEIDGVVPHVSLAALACAAPDHPPVSIAAEDMDAADRDAVAALLTDASREVVTHGAKLLDHAAHANGWSLTRVVLDTELAGYLVSPEQRSFELDRLALQYLQRSLAVAEPATGDQLAFDEAGRDLAALAHRAQATLELAATLGAILDERGQRELLERIELPLAPVLARMERAGIAIDRDVLDELRTRLVARVADLEDEVHDHAGRTFNIGSGPQLQAVLFDELELPHTRKIKTGYSTDAQALASLRGQHPIIEAILEWRELTKLLSTYIDALPPLIDASTKRIHTTLSQTVAATGRLASSRPNLQNIPVRRQEGREIRRAFVPGEGFDWLLVADYSQIELRILAHLSGDEGLLEAFAAREDIHATTAAKVFELPLDQVDGALRDRAKAVNYGLAYGLTSYGLGQQLGIPPDEAQEIVDAYFARFPKVRSFLDSAVASAANNGYTTTLFGRRRYLPDLRSDDRNRRQMAERMALNAPIQGTAADIIKLATVALQQALDQAGMASQQLLQVHDEVILEVVDDERDEVERLTVDTLGSVAELAVDLEVDTAFGRTWYDAQKH